jgi:hypothetical protein
MPQQSKRIRLSLPNTKEKFKLTFVGLAVLLFFGTVIRISWLRPIFHGDTAALIISLNVIKACLKSDPSGVCGGVVHFPVFQFLPGLFLKFIHFSDGYIFSAFRYLSLGAFFGIVGIIGWFFRKSKQELNAHVALLVLISSPLVWYVLTTLNELPAALVTVLFTIACLRRSSPWIIGALIFLAGLTKEIAFPFLMIIGLTALLPDLRFQFRRVWKLVAAMFLGGGLAVLCNLGFNYFRFRTLTNFVLLQKGFQVPSWNQHGKFFAALWFSPNGGILFFFVPFALLLGVLSWSMIQAGREHRLDQKGVISWIPLVSVWLVLFGLTFGFSGWFAPFGWVAWGPRLLLPWIPSLLVLILYFYSKNLQDVFIYIRARKWMTIALLCLVCVHGLPQFTVLFETNTLWNFFSPQNADCPGVYQIDQQPDLYYRCINHLAWPSHVYILIDLLRLSFLPKNLFHTATYLGAVLALAWKMNSSMNQSNKKSNQ